MLLLIKTHTDVLIEQTETKPQETLEFILKKQRYAFAFSHPKNLSEEGKSLLAVTSSEATNCVLIITDENNSFSLTTPGHWNSEDGEEAINKLKNLLEFRSESDIDLHVKEVEKRSTRTEIETSGYNLENFDHLMSEILPELRRVNKKISEIWSIGWN